MKPALRGFLLRWHHRLGLLAFTFVVVLSVTGIALNHTHELGLGRLVHQRWLLALYGMEPHSPQVAVAHLGETSILYDGVNRLYRGTREVASCSGTVFGGAVPTVQGWLALCGEELLVFDAADHLQERIGMLQGLPAHAFQLGQGAAGIAVRDGQQAWAFDLDTLQAVPWPAGQPVDWSVVANVPADSPGLPAIPPASTLTLEQVLLDLHSGRLFGRITVWLVDLSGVALLLLGVSGLWVWGTRRLGR